MNIDRFQWNCGPAVLASVLDVSREEAARRILAVRGARHRRARCATWIGELARVLVEEGLTTPVAPFSPRDRITLAQWLREYPKMEAILRTGHHFVHVSHGKVVEDNGVRSTRKRVTHLVPIQPRRS